MFELDQPTFGLPTWKITQTQRGQFARLPGDRGRGYYKALNPTGAIPVSLQWEFDGDQMRQFNEAWQDRDKLCWGAAWFLLDLPIGLPANIGTDAELQYLKETPITVHVTVGTSDAGRLGWEQQLPNFDYGGLVPSELYFNGLRFDRISSTSPNTQIFIEPAINGDEGPIPYNEDGIEISVLQHPQGLSKRYPSLYSEAGPRYSINGANYDQDLKDIWIDGAEIDMIFYIKAPVWKKYVCSPAQPFTSSIYGEDNWRVNMSIEVDVSPQMIVDAEGGGGDD